MKICLPRRRHQAGVLTVMVVGGRMLHDDYTVFDALDQIEALCDARGLSMIVLQGGTPGAPKLARTWAWHNHVHLIAEHVDWQKLGPQTGGQRNQAMIDKHHPDICLAMLPGPGAADMARRCQEANIPVYQLNGEDRGRE
jgi:hypothetical protein